MSDTSRVGCQETQDALSLLVDGGAPAELFDHVADCDACRDLRHDGIRVAEIIAAAGADFRAEDGFASAMLVRVLEARPNGPVSGEPPLSREIVRSERSRDADPPAN